MIPNLLSLLRIVLIPLFLYLIFTPSIMSRGLALFVFLIASLTDLLDGWSARKLNQETETGRFLDPLADKLLVVFALIAFLILDPLIPMWMVLIIISRDILITFMRYLSIKKGAHLRTSKFGKVKTAFQMISIMIIIMVYIAWSFDINISHPSVDELVAIEETVNAGGVVPPVSSGSFFRRSFIAYEIMTSDHPNKWLIVAPYCLMFIVTLLTFISGMRYILTNWRLFLPPYSTGGDE